MAETTITIQPDSTSLSFSLTPSRTKTVTGTYSFSTTTGSLSGGPFSSTDSGYSYSNYASSQSKTFTIPQEAVNSLISVKFYATTSSSYSGNFSSMTVNGTGVTTNNNATFSVTIPISQVSTSTKIYTYVEAIRTFTGSDSVTTGSIQHSGQYYAEPSLSTPSSSGKYEKVYRTDTYTQTGTARSGSLTGIYLEVTYGDGGQAGGGDSGDTTSYGAGSFIGVGDVAREIKDYFIGIDNIARKVKEVYIGVNGVAKKIYPAITLGKLIPGDIVQLDENGDGTLVDWIVMHQNYYGNNATVLMRKTILTNKYLAYSGSVGQYGYPYAEEEADNYLRITWLQAKSEDFQNLLVETPIVARTWAGTTKSINRKVWLPAAVNLSGSKPDFSASDQRDDPSGAFSYFTTYDTNADRIAYNNSDTATSWWTRSPVGGTHPYCRAINASGTFNNWNYSVNAGLRPVINIASNTLLEEVSDGIYYIMSLGGGGQADLISFTVDGTTYQAENGMTWGAWVESEYNTDGFLIDEDYGQGFVHDSNLFGIYLSSDSSEVYASYNIYSTAYETGPGTLVI